MSLQQALDREQPLVDPLRVIQPVHPEDLGDSGVASGGGTRGEPFDLGDVDADGVDLDRYLTSLEPHQPRAAVHFAAEQPLGAGQHVIGVGPDVHPDQVRCEHALDQIA